MKRYAIYYSDGNGALWIAIDSIGGRRRK